MDEDRKQKIIELAKRAHAADQLVEALNMQNTYGLSAEESEKQAVEYALAKAEADEANVLLNMALSGSPGTEEPEEEITITPGWPLL